MAEDYAELLDAVRAMLESERWFGLTHLPVRKSVRAQKPVARAASVPPIPHAREAARYANSCKPPAGAGGKQRMRRPPRPGPQAAEKIAKLGELEKLVKECKRCGLAKGRTNAVFGEGSPDAEIMFIGEAPGRDEDVQGRPFVGRAGQLLDRVIEAMGLRRQDVYIGNIVKCRPPGNRSPHLTEISACARYIFKQIKIIQPKIIVALGNVAVKALLSTDASITVLRGKFHDFEGTKLLATYHPAYILRNPAAKEQVWEDMKRVLAELDRDEGQAN